MKLNLPLTATETGTNGISERIEEIRQALTSETDILGGVAGQLGHEIGTQAVKVGHEASSAALPRLEQLLGLASLVGGRLMLVGRRSARDLGRDARTLGEELRHVRLTTEPKRTSPTLLTIGGLFAGLTAGLALMWFFDPEQGRKRRAAVRDSIVGVVQKGRDRTAGAVQQAQTAIGRPLTVTPELAEPSEVSVFDRIYSTSTVAPKPEEEPVSIG